MKDGQFWRLGAVSDTQLRSALGELLAGASRTEARIIAYLSELEARQIHLKDGSASLYAYCIHVLRLSNSEAFYRITAARIARRFPIVFTLVEQRQLHLTAVCLLRDYLTQENHEELLRAAAQKTKWQIQELLAKRFPRPDVESRIRKLPAPRTASRAAPAPRPDAITQLDSLVESSFRESAAPTSQLAQPVPESKVIHKGGVPTGSSCPGVEAAPVPRTMELRPPSEAQMMPSSTGRSALSHRGEPTHPDELTHPGGGNVATDRPPLPGSRTVSPTRPRVEPQPVSTTRIEPLSESRYRIQLNASVALKEKLDRLRALTSHSNPRGDIAIVIERALEIAIEQVEKRRFAKTDQPRRATQSALEKQPRAGKRKHVSNAVRREVAQRDGQRCTYRASNGDRCTARAFLQLHHEHPWARGGGETVSNLRLLCGPHNRLLAQRDFGAQHVAKQIQKRLTPDASEVTSSQTALNGAVGVAPQASS